MKTTIASFAKTCVLTASLAALPGNAAEFDSDEILPAVSSLVFTREAVLATLETSAYLGSESVHFAAKRSNYEFCKITAEDRSELLVTNYYHRKLDGAVRLRDGDGRYDLVDRGLSLRVESACTPDLRAVSRVSHDDFDFAIELQCGVRISDAVLNDGRLWIATSIDSEFAYENDMSQQGVIVATLQGTEETRIAVGDHTIHGLAVDPWTRDVWIVTRDRVVQASVDREVRRQFWPVLDFSEEDGRPGTFIRESSNRVLSNPLALVAHGLGEPHYRKFYDAIKDLPDSWDQEIMYNYAMNGPDWVSMPILPTQLNVLIDDAEPTGAWRRFVCLLDDERAKMLCRLHIDSWP